MSINYRRAFIEFIGKKIVVISTSFRQKKFFLEKDYAITIDLIDLKKTNADTYYDFVPSSFFIQFEYDEMEDSFIGEVIAKTSKDSLDIIGLSDCKKYNKRNFKIPVWIDD